MMRRWEESTRSELSRVLPEALVLLAIGAVEQHGPHLPTGTDILLSSTAVERAARLAADRCSADLVVAPAVPIGASDHHLPFGGTISLSPATMLAVLGDVLRTIATSGARRVLIVNGHGGNVGVAHAAAAAASAHDGLDVACVDYWRLAPVDAPAPVPGHAGRFETSLVLGLRPDLVAERLPRDPVAPALPAEPLQLHSAATWTAMDGYSDQPAEADQEAGVRALDAIAAALAERIVELAALSRS